MNRKVAVQRLETILKPDLDLITSNSIVLQESGYCVFDQYLVQEQRYQVCVTKKHQTPEIFTTTRIALSWCIADKYNQYNLAREICRLDRDRLRIRQDLQAQNSHLKKVRDPDLRETLRTKIDNKKYILAGIDHHLDKCVSVAKYWQLRGFNDEIARTRRPAPNRTVFPSDRKSIRQTH